MRSEEVRPGIMPRPVTVIDLYKRCPTEPATALGNKLAVTQTDNFDWSFHLLYIQSMLHGSLFDVQLHEHPSLSQRKYTVCLFSSQCLIQWFCCAVMWKPPGTASCKKKNKNRRSHGFVPMSIVISGVYPISWRTRMRIFPRMLSPLPLQTPKWTSFHQFTSMSSALPVLMSFARSAGI